MAGPARSRWPLIALFVALVLAAHGMVLGWLASQWHTPPALRPLATPLLTREIRPSAPVSQQKRPLASVKSKDIATNTVAIHAPPDHPAAPPDTPASAAAADLPRAPAPNDPPGESVAEPAATPPADTAAAPASAAASAAATPPDAWPADTRLQYRVTGYYRGELTGDGTVQWQRDRERYQVRVEVSLGWLVQFAMTSQGVVSPGGLLPEAYDETRNGTARRTVRMQGGEVLLGNGTHIPLQPGMQDTASQFVAFSHRFRTGAARLAVGETVQMWLARPGGADLWTYDIVASETLYPARLPPVEAFHLKPRPLAQPRGPITAELWFAPSLQYLPVRIRMNVGSDSWLDLLIDRIEQR